MRNIASVCLEIGYPTLASLPHSIINGYKRVLAVAVETDYSFPLADKVKCSISSWLYCRIGFGVAVQCCIVDHPAKSNMFALLSLPVLVFEQSGIIDCRQFYLKEFCTPTLCS